MKKAINLILIICLIISCFSNSIIFAEGGISPTAIDLPIINHTYITISQTSVSLKLGESILVKATTYPTSGTASVVWTSSDPTIAAVNDGYIIAHSSGNATITATYDGAVTTPGTTSVTCSVTVSSSKAFEDGIYFIENVSTGNFANVSNSTYVNTQALSGANSNKWQLIYDTGYDCYRICSVSTNKYLSASTVNSAVTQTTALNSSSHFRFMKTGNDRYALVATNGSGASPVAVSLPSSGSNLISATYTSNSVYTDEWKLHRMLPTSGSEIAFSDNVVSLWESVNYSYSFNCYGYAINNQLTRMGTAYNGQNPGHYAGITGLIYRNDTANNSVTANAAFQDFCLFSSDNSPSSYEFTPMDRYDQCDPGTYKVALVVCSDGNVNDYHWYRQDEDGLWSHKLGSLAVSRLDSDGKLIIDPLEAERAVKDWNTGELIYEYDVFVGYYQVTPWNRFYSPESIASSVLCDYKEPINLQIDLFEEIEIGMNMCQVADLLGSFGDFALSSSKPDAAYFGNDGTVLYVYYDYVYDQLSANNVYLVKSVEIKGAAA